MKKTYDIQIGNKIFFNKIGVLFGILGSILTGFFGIPSNDVALYVYTSDVNRADMIIKSFIKNKSPQ